VNHVEPMRLPDWLKRRAVSHPNGIALEGVYGSRTYAALYDEARALAQELRRIGVVAGATVAVLMYDGYKYARTVHGLMQAGAILVPLNVRLSDDELAWQVADAGASLLLVDDTGNAQGQAVAQTGQAHICVQTIEDLLLRMADAAEDLTNTLDAADTVTLSDVHAIIYTSGTTGRPKGVQLTYGNHWWAATASALQLGLCVNERWLVPMPLFHVGGLQVLMRSLIYGTTAVIHNKFEPIAVNRALDDAAITLVSLVPTMLQRLLEARGDRPFGGALRCVLLGGSAAPRPLLERALALGAPISQSYGLTEADSQVCTLTTADSLRKLGASGKPLLPTEVAIWADGGYARPDVAGEIFVRGPTVTSGYHNRPEANVASFHEGWFRTGDIGYLDNEGYLYVIDRRIDMIVSGGENVYPAEVEAILLSHPDIAEVGVVGLEDETWGQVPAAFVVLKEDKSLRLPDLVEFCRTRLARYKTPKALYVLNTLPRNASGKLLRKNLRQWLNEQR